MIPTGRFPSIVLLAAALASPAVLPFQGVARDTAGNPVVDGTHTALFALYGQAEAGDALWQEERTLTTRNGAFALELGSIQPIPDDLLGPSSLYLGVRIDGGEEGGRVRLTGASRSLRSGFADTVRATRRADSATSAASARLTDSTAAARRADSTASATSARLTDSATAVSWIDSVRIASRTDTARTAPRLAGEDSSILGATRDSIGSIARILSENASDLASLKSLVATSDLGSLGGISWNLGIVYGSLTDPRDGQVYRTVTIGSQTWMAQNLNYAGTKGDSGRCYKGSADSCAKYGRLYAWAEIAKDTLPSGLIRGLCPSGWHVPTDSQWLILERSVGMADTTSSKVDYRTTAGEGTKLRSVEGWGTTSPGTDLFGFRVLPAGEYDGGYSYAGRDASFWTATTSTTYYYPLAAYDRGFQARAEIWRSSTWKTKAFSLRCLQN